MSNITKALDFGYQNVKVNVVVMKSVNDHEIVDFVNLTKDLPIYVRFIEYMPFDGNRWKNQSFVPYSTMLKQIQNVHSIEREQDEANDTSKVFHIIF
jgi:molybdenum cofactor biosynthesis enzyme MoaA